MMRRALGAVLVLAALVNSTPTGNTNSRKAILDVADGTTTAMESAVLRWRDGLLSHKEIAVLKESLHVVASSASVPISERKHALDLLAEVTSAEQATPEALAWARKELQNTGNTQQSSAPLTNHLGQTLVFNEDFNSLNMSVWTHEITMGGGGNWEFEYYTNNRTNSFVQDGVLHIQPTLTVDTIGQANLMNGFTMDLWGDVHSVTSCTDNSFYGCSRASTGSNIINPIQSAAVKTIDSFSFKYGTLEVRAKMPKGDWIWPAIWLLPKWDSYGKWPASGEIDLVESRGNANGYPGGVDTIGTTLHYGPFYPLDNWQVAHNMSQLKSGDYSDDFHVFGLVWTESSMTTYVDDPSNVVLNLDMSNRTFWELGGYDKLGLANPWSGSSSNMAPFDQEFFIKLNVAVGGATPYWPDGVGGKPWVNTSPTAALDFWNGRGQWQSTWDTNSSAMLVDWVRVYQ